ncbi:hypothetical protein JL721_11038 [Aureococcus anophagefferens]|nr:hypothetical protein JL721_11038 [Aureococcus anophagefferens]
MPREPDIPRAYHNGVDMLDTRNWSDSAFEHGPPLPQPDFSGLLRAGKRLPAIGPMDTWGTRMVKSGAFKEQDMWGNPKEEEARASWAWSAGCAGPTGERDDPGVSLETLDHFLRRYHIMGWVRMSNGEVHRVDREECEACELPDDVLAECKEFIENNLAFNQDMMYRAKHGDDYQAEFDRKDAYDLERERYRRSGEQDPEAEKDRAEYERKNRRAACPGLLPPFRKDVDTKADLLTGQRPHVQYW